MVLLCVLCGRAILTRTSDISYPHSLLIQKHPRSTTAAQQQQQQQRYNTRKNLARLIYEGTSVLSPFSTCDTPRISSLPHLEGEHCVYKKVPQVNYPRSNRPMTTLEVVHSTWITIYNLRLAQPSRKKKAREAHRFLRLYI